MESSPDDPDAHRRLLEEAAAYPEALARLLAGAPAEALRRPASDGGWGVVEILCHLRDWEAVFLDRVGRVLAEDRPDLPAYDDALWEIERDYRAQDPSEVLAEFDVLRGKLVDVLAGLDDDGWRRIGNHAINGPVDVAWLVSHLQEHGVEHLQQAREALA